MLQCIFLHFNLFSQSLLCLILVVLDERLLLIDLILLITLVILEDLVVMSLVIKLRAQLFCSHLVDTLKLTTTLIHFVVFDIPYVAQFLRTNLIFVTQALAVISHLIIPVVCF